MQASPLIYEYFQGYLYDQFNCVVYLLKYCNNLGLDGEFGMTVRSTFYAYIVWVLFDIKLPFKSKNTKQVFSICSKLNHSIYTMFCACPSLCYYSLFELCCSCCSCITVNKQMQVTKVKLISPTLLYRVEEFYSRITQHV